MKLHLPKQLFTALITAMTVSLPCTLAGDSISINFYAGNKTIGSQTAGATLFGVDVTDWNDISASGAQTRELTVTTANEQNLLLTLTTPQVSWGPNEANTSSLEDKLQASYLDVSANSSNSHWEIRLEDAGDMWLKDVTFYMAGDGGTQYDAINVNGTNYVGGVNQTGSDNWGDRSTNSDGSVSYSTVAEYDGSTAIADADLNAQRAVRVTGIFGDIVAYNIDNTAGRGSLAGLQIVDSTDSRAYTATLGTTADLGSIVWNKQGETTTLDEQGNSIPLTLGTIAEGSRYLSLTADAEGSSLQLTANATIDGLQLKENNLTVSAEGEAKLTVGSLHANANTTLTMNLGLTGTKLALTGLGTISLSDYSYAGGITVSDSTTLHLQSGAQTSGQIINRGTVLLTRGNEGITLNSLVGENLGQYKQAVVSNTSTGNLVIQHAGTATLSTDLIIANGGKVTLKGGTLGTADASITHKISGENNTELVLDGVDAYVGADRALAINLHLINGTTLNLTHNDTLLYHDTDGSNTTTIGAGSFLNVGGFRQMVSSGGDRSVFVMAGGTIYGAGGPHSDGGYTAGLDFYNSGKITATENSLIATGIAARDSNEKVTFDVASGKTLTLGVYSVDGEAVSSAALVGNGSFVKSGAGILSYQVAPLSHALEITGGEFEYVMNDDRTHTGNITGTGTFAKSGTGALTLDSDKTSVSTLKVNAGEIIYNSTTDTTHTLAGAAGSKFTKNGSGTLTVATESYLGDIEVSEGTLKFDGTADSTTNNSNREIAVQTGATLDINGKARHYEVVLNQGATLTNTGAATGDGQRQLHTITLNGDATVSGTGNFYLINSSYNTTYLNLNQHTLTKTGTNTFYLRNTTVQSAGVIRVEGGTVETWSSGAGTLDISKASLEIANGGSFVLGGKNQQIQNLTLEAGGSLTVNNGLTLTAQGAAVMNGGTVSGNLCLTGTMTLAGDVDLSGATLSGTSMDGFKMLETAKPTSSGFNSLTYQLWEGTGNVTTTQTSISVGGETYDFNSSAGTFSTVDSVYYVVAGDTIDTGETTAGATSFVVDGTLNVTADTSAESILASTGTVNVASAATLSLTAAQTSSIGQLAASDAIINLAAGSTLSLGQSGTGAQETTSSIGTVNVAESAATIHLTEKATLNPLTKTGNGTITLTGNGTYKLAEVYHSSASGTNHMPAGVSLSGEAWRGTVLVSNSQLMGVNLNNLGNAHSYVKLNGLGAWIHTSHKTINTNLILENYSDERSAFIITDSSENNEYIFNGSVSGTGDFQLSSRAGSASIYTFNGDTSQWSGGIIISPTYNGAPYTENKTTTPTYTVNLYGGGNVFAEGADGISMNRGGTLNLVIGKAGVKSFMNGAISRSTGTLNLTAQGDTEFNKSVSASKLTLGENACVTLGGVSHTIDSLVASANSELILSDGAVVVFGASESATMTTAALKNLQLEGATVTWQSSSSTIQKLNVKKDSFWTIKDMSANATLTFNTVSVDENVKLTVNKEGVESWNQNLHIGVLTGAGDIDISGPRSPEGTVSSLAIDSLVGFSGDMTITSHESGAKVYNATVNTGSEGTVSMGVLKFVGFAEAGESSRAVFNVQNNTTVGTINVSGGGTTINIEETGTLHAFTKEGSGTITLTGSGAYDLGSNTSTNVSGLDAAAWTGTVRISSATEPAGVNLNSFGNSRSYLELSGVAKWLSDKTTNVNLLLKEHETESYGFKITGTDAGGTYTFNGSISGDGDLVIGNGNEYSGQRTFTFAGDLSEWQGRLILGLSYGSNQNNPTVNLSYAGSADAAPTFFSGDDSGIRVDENHAGTLTVNIGNENADTTAVMNGSITNVNTNDNGEEVVQGSINLNVKGDTNFNKDVVVTKMVVNAGKTATLTGDANSLKAGNATITSKAETDAALSNVTVEAGSISAASTANGAKGSISNADVRIAQLAQDASFTIQDMTLTNTTITAATVETRVNLSNVSGDATLAKGKFHMQGQLPVALVNAGGSAVEFSSSALSGLTLNTADSSASLVVDLGDLSCLTPMGPGQYDLTITLSGFTMEGYTGLATGAGLVFAADSWLGSLLNQAQNANVQMTIAQAKAGAAAAAEGGSASGVSYSTGNVGTIITINGLNVPEPTTSTLSLLALAALAARRRRND